MLPLYGVTNRQITLATKRTYQNWLLPLFSFIVVAIQFIVTCCIYDQTVEFALTDSAISLVLVPTAIWLVTLIINNYPTKVGILLYSIIIATIISLVTEYLNEFIIRLIVGPKDEELLCFLSNSMPIRYIVIWLLCAWTATYIALRKKNDTLEKKLSNQSDANTLLREAELYKLRQQLQPHFLYNSLNSINALIYTSPDQAQEMTGKLSDFLRSSVNKDAKENIPVAEELKYIQSYLDIEAIRFGNRLNIDIDDKSNGEGTIPPFLLQPILENAVKYGVYGNTGEVNITISIDVTKEMLQIIITNPYDPDSQPKRGTGFGLKGVKRRLYLLYSRADLLQTNTKDGIFETLIKIPQIHV